MGKKRKSEVDLDAERTLYSSFSAAANSISQLYTQAVQQQRKASSTAAKQAIDKIICGVVRDFGNCEVIPVSTLLHYLQHEYESCDQQDIVIQPHPLQGLPQFIQEETDHHQKAARSPAGCLHPHTSPSRRGNPPTGMNVDEERHSMMEVSQPPQFAHMQYAGHNHPFAPS